MRPKLFYELLLSEASLKVHSDYILRQRRGIRAPFVAARRRSPPHRLHEENGEDVGEADI